MKLSFRPNIKPSKTVITLGVAVAIGLLAALAARSYLSNRMEAIEARGVGQTVDLIVAKQDLDKGAELSSDNMVIRKVPVDYAHAAAIEPGSFGRIDGEKLAYPVKAGQMIMWGLLENKRAPTFSTRIDVGHRAMTVPVDEISSISGMLEPGDLIDLIVTIDHEGKKTTFPLLQNVQVMATGQRSVDGRKEGERKDYSTVTLDTTPEQAQNVIMAREGGKITALLRNPQDKQKMGSGSVDLASMLNGRHPGAGSGSAGASSTDVPVLYGGSGNNFTPEQLQLNARRRVSLAASEASLSQTPRMSAQSSEAVEQAARQIKRLAGGHDGS